MTGKEEEGMAAKKMKATAKKKTAKKGKGSPFRPPACTETGKKK